MSASKISLIRGGGGAAAAAAAASRNVAALPRSSRLWHAQQKPLVKVQRAAYAIPPHDKHEDDLGGPYGQESPNPAQRKRTDKSAAWQAAGIVAAGMTLVVVGGTFFNPRSIANYQIKNDTVIGAPKSNPGSALAAVKRKDGVQTSHQLHEEVTGSKYLGSK